MKWPIREALLCYTEMLVEEAARSYEQSLLLYGLGVAKKPEKPSILKAHA